jgi:hypothetical protein
MSQKNRSNFHHGAVYFPMRRPHTQARELTAHTELVGQNMLHHSRDAAPFLRDASKLTVYKPFAQATQTIAKNVALRWKKSCGLVVKGGGAAVKG